MTAKLSAEELATYTDEDCKRDIGLLMGIATAMPDAAVFLAHVADQLKRSVRLTAQVREAEARWEALKAWMEQRKGAHGIYEREHCVVTLIEMARLERESPPAREGSEG